MVYSLFKWKHLSGIMIDERWAVCARRFIKHENNKRFVKVSKHAVNEVCVFFAGMLHFHTCYYLVSGDLEIFIVSLFKWSMQSC